MSCSEFYAYALANHKLLKAVASGEKYYWRKSKTPVAATTVTTAVASGGTHSVNDSETSQ